MSSIRFDDIENVTIVERRDDEGHIYYDFIITEEEL